MTFLATQLLIGRAALAAWRFARHAAPHLLQATVGPSVCFLTGRALWGLNGALALALGWTGSCMALRAFRGKRMSGLLCIGATTLVLRAIVSLAMHSANAFFLAPAVVTAVMGMVYMGSALTRKPLLGRVLGDLVPSSFDLSDPGLLRISRIGSFVWGAEQTISAVVSIVLLMHVSTTKYVTMHEPVSWLIFLLVIGAAVPFFWGDIGALRVQRRAAATVAPALVAA